MEYDLEERTASFGEKIIVFVKSIKNNPINNPFINQVVRSGTSIGANYMEADCASTKKDFKYKISLCRKETKETKHWLRMLAKSNPKLRSQIKILWKEAHELTLIFSAILNSNKR
jgi:four helix bundle protein